MKIDKNLVKSPFNLLQEIYYPDLYKMTLCCIMLNQTTRKQADLVRDKLFAKYPTAEAMSEANVEDVKKLIRPLGFYNRRANSMINFAKAYLKGFEKDQFIKLPGVGQYANDSYLIFHLDIIPEKVHDHVLAEYAIWLREKRKGFDFRKATKEDMKIGQQVFLDGCNEAKDTMISRHVAHNVSFGDLHGFKDKVEKEKYLISPTDKPTTIYASHTWATHYRQLWIKTNKESYPPFVSKWSKEVETI